MSSLKTKKIIYSLFILFFAFYISWEFYWYSIVGLSCIKWHSHIMLFFIPLSSIIIYNDWLTKKPSKLNVSLILVFLTLFIWESTLTILGTNKTQQEKMLGYNVDQINEQNNYEQYYHINEPNKTFHIKKPEFTFDRKTNSLGYSDYELVKRKSKNETRILCLGDSFTEGDGAPFEKSYVYQLRENFLKSPNYYVFNAGKCGSDPFFNFLNYRDILRKYDFNIVLQTLSSSDLYDDIKKRGGFERFKKKYVLKYRQPNSFIKHGYIMSYVGRSFLQFLGYNELIVTNEANEIDCNKTLDLLNKYQEETKKNKTKFVLILLPNKKEVVEYYPLFFIQLVNKIKKNKSIYIIDLRELYKNKMREFKGDFINSNWWEEDWHHTPQGYSMMANCIYQGLIQKGLVN